MPLLQSSFPTKHSVSIPAVSLSVVLATRATTARFMPRLAKRSERSDSCKSCKSSLDTALGHISAVFPYAPLAYEYSLSMIPDCSHYSLFPRAASATFQNFVCVCLSNGGAHVIQRFWRGLHSPTQFHLLPPASTCLQSF